MTGGAKTPDAVCGCCYTGNAPSLCRSGPGFVLIRSKTRDGHRLMRQNETSLGDERQRLQEYENVTGGTRMRSSEREHTGMLRRWRLIVAATLGASALVGVLVFTSASSQASSPHQAAGAALACSNYERAEQATVAPGASGNPATVVDSYSTTAQNLEVWLRSFMPMADPAVIQKLPSSTMVTACVLQGSWVLPAGGSTGSADENYEVLMIGPDGAATPVLFGPSAIANAAAPEVGSN